MKKFLLTIFIINVFFLFNFSSVKARENLTEAPAKNRIYVIQIDYNRGQVSFGEVSTKLGYAPEPERKEQLSQNQYWIELESFSGQILEQRLFSIQLEIFSPPPLEGDDDKNGPVILEQTTHLVILPYYSDGKLLKLYDANKNLLREKDVGFLAQVCGDDVCQDHESFADCSKDCSSFGKDDYCNEDELNNDPDCQNLQKISVKKLSGQAVKIIIFGIAVIIIIIAVAVYLYFVKKKKRENNDKKE